MSPIAGNVPSHLTVAARTGFLNSVRAQTFPYPLFTETFDMGAQSQLVTDLGSAPMPKKSPSGMTVQDFIEKSLTLTVEDWDITVHLEYNAAKDDQTGKLKKEVSQAGRNFEKHINKRSFQFLNGGDSATFGQCYDSGNFFRDDHTDDGAEFQTDQDNLYALNLSLVNFNTVWAAAVGFKDDRGEFENFEYDLLVVNQSNRQMAVQIADNPNVEGTGNRDINSFQGEVNFIKSPEFDTNAWVLLSTKESFKPIILAMREKANLQHAWLEPGRPGGGWWMWKFYARYEHHYGNWRLAIMGQT